MITEVLVAVDQALLVGRDALLVLDLDLEREDRLRQVDLDCDGLAA